MSKVEEEEDSMDEEKESEEIEKEERHRINEKSNGLLEEERLKAKSNLEILLTQNDILPLLKKINTDSKNKNKNILFENYLKNQKVSMIILILENFFNE